MMQDDYKYYLIQVSSNSQNKFVKELNQYIIKYQLEIQEIRILTVTNKKGEVQNIPGGYILIKCILGPRILQTVRELRGHFVSYGKEPAIINEQDLESMYNLQMIKEETKKFNIGDTVEIINPNDIFATFKGVISDINEEKQEATLTIKAFGKPLDTKVSLQDIQVLEDF